MPKIEFVRKSCLSSQVQLKNILTLILGQLHEVILKECYKEHGFNTQVFKLRVHNQLKIWAKLMKIISFLKSELIITYNHSS